MNKDKNCAPAIGGRNRWGGTRMSMPYRQDDRSIVDVTKAPYFCDNTGHRDCTPALRQAMDDILRPNIEGVEKMKRKLLASDDPNIRIGFENHREGEYLYVIFPEEPEPTKILYFPDGEYLLSDTVTYTLDNLSNIFRNEPLMELNRQIHFKGESRDGVTLRLMDHAHGFEYGMDRPVVSFMQAEKSNVAMTNSFEDITIDVGAGNPGAVGLVFYANNTGTVKNVRIRSSDPEKKGYAGLEIRHEIVSGCFVDHVEIEGFDYGIRAIPMRNHMVFENILLRDPRKVGIFVDNSLISLRRVCIQNAPKGVVQNGSVSHLVLVDSEIYGDNPFGSAVECGAGACFLRNVHTGGYRNAVTYAEQVEVAGPYIEEYVSEPVCTLFPTEERSEPLPVEETPELPLPAAEEWCCVCDFGAVGDGVTDDTAAIQRAMDSGARFIFFQPGKYFVNGSIVIPGSVERVNFRYCDFIAGERLRGETERGFFIVTGDGGALLLEDVFTWEKFYGFMRFVEHAGKRTLVLSDLHTQTAAMYFNSVEGGRVFIEDCGCTTGAFPYREVTAYSFRGQQVWARHINPERSVCEILNDRSRVWIMGFKTESFGTAFKTVNGGHTEVLGGGISIGRNRELPAIRTIDSTCSIVASNNGYSRDQIFPLVIEETKNGVTKKRLREELPIRFLSFFRIPLYVTRQTDGEE